MPDLLTELLALEDALACGRRLDALLHPDFLEFGCSGRRWTRAEVLAEWGAPSETPPQRESVELLMLAPNLVQLRWRSPAPRPAWRSSLWQRDAQGWKMRFHQATALPA